MLSLLHKHVSMMRVKGVLDDVITCTSFLSFYPSELTGFCLEIIRQIFVTNMTFNEIQEEVDQLLANHLD